MRLEYENNKWEKEIPCDPWLIGEMNSNEQGLWFESREDRIKRWHREDKIEKLFAKVMKLVKTELTQKQREALQLYYLKEKTYRQMGKIMGISFQRCSNLVSDGIRNVQKACAKAGIEF